MITMEFVRSGYITNKNPKSGDDRKFRYVNETNSYNYKFKGSFKKTFNTIEDLARFMARTYNILFIVTPLPKNLELRHRFYKVYQEELNNRDIY